MTLPVQDPFWTEITDFIRGAIGADAPFIGPRELRDALPKCFAYDWVQAIEVLDDYKGAAVHKGLMHELPVAVLQVMRDRWKCVFAGAVFLFFMPPGTPLPAISGDHLHSFYDGLLFLEKLDAAKRSVARDATAALVLAHGQSDQNPERLGMTLRSLSLLHLSTAVVPVSDDETFLRACRELCTEHRAGIVEIPAGGAPEALKAGVMHLLGEETNIWISTFDDSVAPRPDFIALMEKWRDPKTRPLLGGWWEQADGALDRFQRDGFQFTVPRRPNARFLYAHRDYWSRRFGKPKNNTAATEQALVIPGLVIPHAGR